MSIEIITNDDDWIIIRRHRDDGLTDEIYQGHIDFRGLNLKQLIEDVSGQEVEYKVVSTEEIEQFY